MDGTGEDAAQDDPQIGGRAEFRAHDGPEDGAGACNVQELDHEDFPGWHRDEIHSVGLGNGRGLPGGIGSEYAFDEGPVEEIAENESGQACDE